LISAFNKHPFITWIKAALIPALCTTAAQCTTAHYMGIQTVFCLCDYGLLWQIPVSLWV